MEEVIRVTVNDSLESMKKARDDINSLIDYKEFTSKLSIDEFLLFKEFVTLLLSKMNDR